VPEHYITNQMISIFETHKVGALRAQLQYTGRVLRRDSINKFMASMSLYPSLVMLTLPELSEAFDTNIPSLTLPKLRKLDLGTARNSINGEAVFGIGSWMMSELDAVWVLVRMERELPLMELRTKYGRKLMTMKLYISRISTAGMRVGIIGSIGHLRKCVLAFVSLPFYTARWDIALVYFCPACF
jgi:hypothetical protein